MTVPGYLAPAEIFYAKIKQYLEDQGKVQQNEVIAIAAGSHGILNSYINAKGIDRLNE
jgi:hypothetical protein